MVTGTQTTQEITLTRTLNAPAAEVFRALTSASALRNWLCDAAEVAASRGGRIYMWWISGYYMVGEFTDFSPNSSLALTWNGKGEAVPGTVRIELSGEGKTTTLKLTHDRISTDPEIAKHAINDWENSLENLQSYTETGIDLRVARRPIFGLSGAEPLNPELAERAGAPISQGLYLHGLVDGMGAKAAGLESGDIVTDIGGHPIAGYENLASALDGRHAGDSVPVTYYRGAEERSVVVVLSARPRQEMPGTAKEVAAQLRDAYSELDKELAEIVAGASADEMSHRPHGDSWCGNEVLAHLIAVSYDCQKWIAMLVEDEEPQNVYHSNHLLRLQAIVSAYPSLPELTEELRRAEAVTLAMLDALPDRVTDRKSDWYNLGTSMLDFTNHRSEHYDELKALLESARA